LLEEGAFVYTVCPYLIPYEVHFRQAASVERSQVVLRAETDELTTVM